MTNFLNFLRLFQKNIRQWPNNYQKKQKQGDFKDHQHRFSSLQ